MTFPAPSTRPVDRPLHDDVRTLASVLGEVIRDLEGDAAYQAVESLRTACRARRRGEPDASGLPELLEGLQQWPLATTQVVARAFTLFFLLINTAEQVHRVRRRRSYPALPPQPGSARWALLRLKDQGQTAQEVASTLADLHISPVLTAHPTESTRRTVLNLQARLAQILIDEDDQTPETRRERIRTEVELLWLTAEVRRDRPSVLDEVSTVLWYLEDRLIDACAVALDGLERAFEQVYGEPISLTSPVVPGSWVGGDRDGNPFVTPEVTLAATRRAAHRVLGGYARAVDDLIDRLSLSTRVRAAPESLRASLEQDRRALPEVYALNEKRDADEPVRLKLSFIAERLRRTRKRVADRDAGQVQPRPNAYDTSEELLSDLLLVRASLTAAGATTARRRLLDPLISEVQTHGFFGYQLDLREDSQVHTEAIHDLCAAIGIAPLDTAGLTQELLGRRPLLGPHLELPERTRKAIDVFATQRQVQRELGARAADTYIISMCQRADDVLRVLLLAKENGLCDLSAASPTSRLDVVPLFETRDDLVRAPQVMSQLFGNPAYKRQLQARGHEQEVMIGYSDSAKDAGMLAAAWALYRGQEEIAEVCDRFGVRLTLFHGRGGTVGRGGGSPVFRGLAALPPGTVRGRIKITEQGELISQKFGLASIAERSLEVLITGTLLSSQSDWRHRVDDADVSAYREVMDELSALALPVYRRLVHDEQRLFALFLSGTPVRALAHVHYGSRPAYREHASGTMTGIRAIPWVFGWTQIRSMLPAWLGTGTALSTIAGRPGGLEKLQSMAENWPFFDDLLGKVEMVLAKADPEIARTYVNALAPDHLPLLDELEGEFQRALSTVLAIRKTGHLLADNPVLQASITLRNPYVDPLNLLQIELLRRQRQGEDDPLLAEVLGTTLNGVAQGMRNTG